MVLNKIVTSKDGAFLLPFYFFYSFWIDSTVRKFPLFFFFHIPVLFSISLFVLIVDCFIFKFFVNSSLDSKRRWYTIKNIFPFAMFLSKFTGIFECPLFIQPFVGSPFLDDVIIGFCG